MAAAAIGGTALGNGLCRLAAARQATVLAIAASVVLPIDSLAPPTAVRTGSCRTAPRTLARRARRTKRKSARAEGGGEDDGFSGDGDGDDGPFGGGGGGWSGGFGGGSGWNFDGIGGDPDGDELRSSSDPAFDLFVHEVLGWAALSSCAHFAYKRIGQFLTDREKAVPVRLVQPIC